MEIKKLKLVLIDDDYIDYLREFEPKVMIQKGEERPYLGILIEIGEMKYLAPLSSPKPKHLGMKKSSNIIQIDDGKLGVINISNMIPVNDTNINNYNPTNPRQKILVNKQLRWFNRPENRDRIPNTVKELYSLYISRKLPKKFAINCNNFKLLDKKCKEWKNKK